MKKKILGMAAAVSLILNAASSPVYGAGVHEFAEQIQEKLPTGLLPMEEVELTADPAVFYYEAGDETVTAESVMKYSMDSGSDWDQYKNYYVYNLMTDEEKEYWDALDVMCLSYMTETIDAKQGTDSSGEAYYYMDGVTSTSLTKEEMKQVYQIFKYHNPQYYYIDNRVITITRGENIYISPGVYSAFAKGADRAEYTKQFQTQVDAWQEQIDACSTDAQKVRLIHDLIVEKVDYNNGIYESSFDENTQYSQSAYSVFCMDKTVCAGYAQAFEMMCNSSDIDSFAVTSATHEWNKVRIDDSWYNVDCTWDDQSTIIYNYFERNDYYFDTVSTNSASSHQEESYWEKYLPLCTLDSAPEGSYCTSPGTLPTITRTTDSPVITIHWLEGDAVAEITCDTEGSDIYYSVDGTLPSPSSVKCRKYTAPFAAEENAVIYAVAVCDTCWDSDLASDTVFCEHKYESRITKDAACAEAGERTYTCGLCGKSYTEVIPAPGHSYDDGMITVEPTTDKGGIRTYTCTTCGHTEQEAIPKLPSSETEEPSSEVSSGTEEPSSENPNETEEPSSEGPGETKIPASTEELSSEMPDGTEEPINKMPKEGDLFETGGVSYRVTKAGTVAYVKMSSKGTNVKIPATIKINNLSYKVTSIAANAFKNNKKITKVVMGNNIQTIGSSAFLGCTNLKTVTLGKKLTSVGTGAFKNCSSLKKIIIPDKVTSIGNTAFSGCKKLTSVTMGTGLRKIGKEAFYKCSKLNTIVIKSKKLAGVGKNAFKGIKTKAEIKVPAKKLSVYKKLLKGKGLGSKNKIVT